MEAKRPNRIVEPVADANRTNNQRKEPENQARRMQQWAQNAVSAANRQSELPFSEHVLHILEAAKKELPQRAPSPAEQPPKQAEPIPRQLKRALAKAADKMADPNWKPKD